MDLMKNPELREQMGAEGRKRVVENFDYRVIAKKFVNIVSKRLGIS
jgi:glycosyltransferase involved in cell wall biosynthesis